MTWRNDFPSADNFQQTSFPQPVPVPDTEPDEGSLLIVGYNPLWTEVLMSALDQLRQFGTWAGDDAAKILGVNRAEALKFLLQEPLTIDDGVPTPFWDSATDVDDEEPADSQVWYGEVTDPEAPAPELDFVEQIGIWAITGFIAYSGNIGAAIAFHTIAPAFVLAWRAGDVGEIFRIVVDAADYGTVDTTGRAGEVIRTPVYGDPSLTAHDIMLIKTG